MKKVTFYHAGCPVCISAEHDILATLDPAIELTIVHLGEEKVKVTEAEALGVKSVPALLTPSGNVLHLNFGASIADLRA